MPRNYKFLPVFSQVKTHTRGYLPHWEAPGATYSITFRLDDALPPGFIHALIEEKNALTRAITSGVRKLTAIEAMEIRARLERKLDAALDCHHGSAHMHNPEVAEIVTSAITYFERTRYELKAWCVMPNHVHAVVRPFEGRTLHEVLHSWKSWSAHQANKVLGQAGRFWQPESFDRIIRDDEDLETTIKYVLDNPIKAGLKDWRWVSHAGWKPADRQAGGLRSS